MSREINKQMPLGIDVADRIKRICSYVRKGEPLYDLCCDHGLIGAYAYEQKLTPEIFMVDRSPRVIKLLKERCQTYLPKNARRHILCQDAKNIVISHNRASVVIAGVGGKTIETILRGIDPQNCGDFRLILAPLKIAYPLRQFLRERHWKLVAEELVLEKGRFRELIILERQGEEVSDFGRQIWQQPFAADYLRFLSELYRLRRQRNPHADKELLAFETFQESFTQSSYMKEN
ncbi:MAG: tRNA (adenine(22)-N(1))-methyltransferase TrmK [Oligoflexus sp.]